MKRAIRNVWRANMAVRRRRAAVHGSADSEWQHRFFIGRARRLVGVAKVNFPDYSAVDRRSVPQLCKAPLSACTLRQPTSHPLERRQVERDVVGWAVGDGPHQWTWHRTENASKLAQQDTR